MSPRPLSFLLLAALAGCQANDSFLSQGDIGSPGTREIRMQTSNLPPVYSPDKADGTFKNPIIFADYSDPDVCRVGDDYYMTASSFSCFPGLPILHSRDLVNWTIIGHALVRYPAPFDKNFDAPAHGAGVWAPSIRHHNGTFYIYFGDPDHGVFMTKTKHPAGVWEQLVCVKEAKGWIDTCPFWDDDGNAYLVHAFANSRAGVANVLDICRLSPDGTRLLDDNPAIPGNGAAVGTRIYDGGQPTLNPPRPPTAAFTSAPRYTTVEGPKFYKRNGYYYVMAPGGGVAQGYQIVFRSKNVLGPYESRIVLDKGSTNVNGPHQGGWVETPAIDGKREDWFIHFQEVLPYGRILHLQPVKWENDWPVMGDAAAGAEKGQPVLTHSMPLTNLKIENPKSKMPWVPQTSDEFDLPKLGLQWQWWANFKPEWVSLTARPGSLRLAPVSLERPSLLYNRPNLLLQKFPAEIFTVTTKVDLSALAERETAGLVLAGKTMSSLSCSKAADGIKILRTNYNSNNTRLSVDTEESAVTLSPKTPGVVYLRMKVAPRGICTFQTSVDGTTFIDQGAPVTAINATWIGAKVGLFCNAPVNATPQGHADFEYFHVIK